MVGETEIRKAFSLSLNGDTVETGCIYGGPEEAPRLDLVQAEPGNKLQWPPMPGSPGMTMSCLSSR